MRYWLISLPRQDLEHCMKIGTFGLNRKHILGNISIGDPIVCCASTKDWKILGTGAASSKYYMDNTSVFLKEGDFPDRFDFESTKKLTRDLELDLMQVIDRLGFVKSLAHWAVYFRNGIVEISKGDWELFLSKIDVQNA